MTDPMYLDYNATTPLDPAVVEAMGPYLRDHFGNPSSDHVYGYRTRAAVHAAREQLAALLALCLRRLPSPVAGAKLITWRSKFLNGHPIERLPNTLNLSFPGLNAATLLAAVRDRVACSTGSACHAGQAAPSGVLLAMGRDEESASAALRLSLGWATTEEEVRRAADVIVGAVHDLTHRT
jgi:cysteine sulfinate desulfinase/cysteine desulfurase-like protein